MPPFELWLDNQLSAIIAKRIKDEFGYPVKSSYILQIKEWEDRDIYFHAKAQPYPVIIISKDGDFPELIARYGTPPKLIKINTGNIRNKPLWQLLKPLLPEAIRILTETEQDIVYIQSSEPY